MNVHECASWRHAPPTKRTQRRRPLRAGDFEFAEVFSVVNKPVAARPAAAGADAIPFSA
jgi:hypothetical protein